MFVNNFSLGIIGLLCAIFAYMTVGPVIRVLIVIITSGVNWCTSHNLLPLLSVFMAPAQVLFLNNVVNHGILAPIGFAQVPELGKSIMFLVDTNNGPLLGTLMAIALFGRSRAKKTAPMAMFIAGIAGIGEVYFPFVLANPLLVFATMGGLAVSLFLQVIMGGGLIGVASPGSLIAIAMMTPKSAIIANLVSISAGFVVSCTLGWLILKISPGSEDDDEENPVIVGGRQVRSVSDFVPGISNVTAATSNKTVQRILVACDSGMGSSAMGASVLRKRLKAEGLDYITVVNDSANRVGRDYDIVITLSGLLERARLSCENENTVFMTVKNFIKLSDYDEAVSYIKTQENVTQREEATA
ncbi:PTS mannitol transporter subunit EIICBA [Escherichia coli]|nr:PTS mannitol transporter subunit EIICBA [Escherichia coli]